MRYVTYVVHCVADQFAFESEGYTADDEGGDARTGLQCTESAMQVQVLCSLHAL